MVVVALAVLVTGCTADWEEVRVEHRPAPAPAKVTGDDGPPPGILAERWRRAGLRTITDPTRTEDAFAVAAGNLVVFDDTGVRTYAVGDGKPGWSYHEPGRTVRGFATDGVVVISSTDAEDPDNAADDAVNRLVGLSAADGTLLWQRENEWRTDELPVADGVIAALPLDRHTSSPVSGIDVHTGEIAWETQYNGCGIPGLDRVRSTDGSLILVKGACAAGVQWDAFDPATGTLLWTQQWDMSKPGVHAGGMTVVDGTTLSDRGEEVVRIDRDGTVHDAIPVQGSGQHGFYQEIDAAPTLSLRDLRTGEEVARGWPSLLGSAVVTGDSLYYVNNAGVADWLPQLVVGNLATGEYQSMPLPGSVQVPSQPLWLGTAGQHLLMASRSADGTAEVVAISSTPTDGPVELGGVPHSSWPDPCSLLAAVPPPPEPGQPDEHEPVSGEGLGTVDLPRIQCVRHLPGGDRLTLRVAWVAATEAQATGRLGGAAGPPGVDEMTPTTNGLIGTVVARIGTVFVEVWSDDAQLVLTALEAVAKHLDA